MDGDRQASMGDPDFVTFADGTRLPFYADPDREQSSQPTAVVNEAIAAMHVMTGQAKTVRANRNLSDIGRAAKIEEAGDVQIATLIRSGRTLDAMEARMDVVEAEWHAVPALDPTNAVGFLMDQERRSYLNGLSPERYERVLNEMANDQHEDLLLAVVRSPVPLGTASEVAKHVWKRRVEARDPVKAGHLAAGRRSLEWGRRHLAHLTGIAHSTTKADQARLARIAASLDKN